MKVGFLKTLSAVSSPASPRAVLDELRAGNRRFVASLAGHAPPRPPLRLPTSQRPKAAILGCADARVPAEIIFDQGPGDLFVVRVAGNLSAPSQVASLAFAVAYLGVGLIVVLGHSQCGAVTAAVDELLDPTRRDPLLDPLLSRIRPRLAELVTDQDPDRPRLLARAVRANVRASVDHLRHAHAFFEEATAAGRLLVVGGEYSLEDATVDFFDLAP